MHHRRRVRGFELPVGRPRIVEVVVIGFLDVAVGRDGICGGMERAWPGHGGGSTQRALGSCAVTW